MAENISRQERVFNKFSKIFIQSLTKDSNLPDKDITIAWWEDFFEHDGVRANMIQAFSNLLFEEDERTNTSVIKEMRSILQMIPKVADANDKNTQAIVHMIVQFIDERAEKIDYQTPEQLIAEAGLEEEEDEDNTPLV